MCSCDEGTPCQAHRGTRYAPDYFDPQNEPALSTETKGESWARVSFACEIDESAGMADAHD